MESFQRTISSGHTILLRNLGQKPVISETELDGLKKSLMLAHGLVHDGYKVMVTIMALQSGKETSFTRYQRRLVGKQAEEFGVPIRFA